MPSDEKRARASRSRALVADRSAAFKNTAAAADNARNSTLLFTHDSAAAKRGRAKPGGQAGRGGNRSEPAWDQRTPRLQVDRIGALYATQKAKGQSRP